MPADPTAGAPVITPAAPFRVTTASEYGTVVAMQFTGASMVYLVVLDSAESAAPTWYAENEITKAWVT